MAESSSGWFGSFSQSFAGVTNGFSGAISALQKDLSEFVETVSGDTKKTAAVITSETETGGVRGAVTGLVSAVKTSLREDTAGMSPPTEPRARPMTAAPVPAAAVCRSEAQLLAVQQDRATYTDDPPEEMAEDYAAWSEVFDARAHTEAISQLLSASEDVRRLHAELVPTAVPYAVFWRRYLFRAAMVKRSAEKRQALVERMAADDSAEGGLDGWDDDLDDLPPASRAAAVAAAARGDEDEEDLWGDDADDDDGVAKAATTVIPTPAKITTATTAAATPAKPPVVAAPAKGPATAVTPAKPTATATPAKPAASGEEEDDDDDPWGADDALPVRPVAARSPIAATPARPVQPAAPPAATPAAAAMPGEAIRAAAAPASPAMAAQSETLRVPGGRSDDAGSSGSASFEVVEPREGRPPSARNGDDEYVWDEWE